MSKRSRKTSSQNNDDKTLRFNLAKWIIIFVFGSIGVLGLTAIVVVAIPATRESYSNVKDILTLLLPVLSAWAGTVLAFYFSRENYESAVKGTVDLVKRLTPDEKLRSILLKDVMIPFEDAIKLDLSGKQEDQFKLKKDVIDDLMEKNGKERLPIINQDGTIKYIAHLSLFNKFIVDQVSNGKQIIENLTLQDVIDNKDYESWLTALETLNATSNLSEAKVLMDKNNKCSDVFISEDGTRNTKVIGWITNEIIREHSLASSINT